MVPMGEEAGARENGKTGGSAPTEFFGGITDLYFTPDLPSDVYVFNILDAHRASERASERCTDASLPLNVQRSTNSLSSPPLSCPSSSSSLSSSWSSLSSLRVHPRLPLISTQIRDLLSASLSFGFLCPLFSLSSPSLLLFLFYFLSFCRATSLLRASFTSYLRRISASLPTFLLSSHAHFVIL